MSFRCIEHVVLINHFKRSFKHGIVQERGLGAFKKKNEIGITPSEYMKENPFSGVKEIEIIRYYMKHMMGEID